MMRSTKIYGLALMVLLGLLVIPSLSSALAKPNAVLSKGSMQLPLRDYTAMTTEEKAYFTEGTETLKSGKVIINTQSENLQITININHATPGRTTYSIWLCELDGPAYCIPNAKLATSKAGSGATKVTITLPYNEISQDTTNVYIALNFGPEQSSISQFIAGPFNNLPMKGTEAPSDVIGFDPNNAGWVSSPTVFIDTDGAPAVGGLLGETIVKDAISDYWDDEGDVDGENENAAGSAWIGFGQVSEGSIGSADIVVNFATLPSGVLGNTSITIDPITHHITSVKITLTTSITTYGLNDENYKNIAAHELGHAIGLGHSGPTGTLMYKFANLTADAYQPLSTTSLNMLDQLY